MKAYEIKTVYVLKAAQETRVFVTMELAMQHLKTQLANGLKYDEFELLTCPLVSELNS